MQRGGVAWKRNRSEGPGDRGGSRSRHEFNNRGKGFRADRGGFRGGRGGGRLEFSGGYRPQVTEDSVPVHAQNEGASPAVRGRTKEREVVVILEKAGLLLGNMGIVDAYERAPTTEIVNTPIKDVRPDIVHQCLLALYDSDLAYHRRLRVYISLFAKSGKVIEVSPALRPPRTYARFRGLMTALLRDGRICSTDGQVLMRVMPGSIAPVIPHGAEVVGITNELHSPVVTATQLAMAAKENPLPDTLQGGIKNVAAFYCISCTDDCDMEGVDYVSRTVCLSAYPMTAHVMCSRLCEAHIRANPATADVRRSAKSE